ncbi:hypothetical protein [Flavobacterium lindanitolerans]|uniref:hypothetical protein n=1 Tax=Flavobacterium lindanitolerans TaxID=428988 RepID=UPI0031D9D838
MTIEQHDIFGNNIWLVINSVKFETEKGIEEQLEQFICYYKYSLPNDINYGEIFKDKNNDRIVFSSIQDARNHAISFLSDKHREKP